MREDSEFNLLDDGSADRLVDMIILALDMKHSQYSVRGKMRTRQGVLENFDQGELLRISDMAPRSAYTFDAGCERLFTPRADELLAHPAEILGDEAEFIWFRDGWLIWTGFRRAKRPPKDVYYVGKPSHFYEYHSRAVNAQGQGEYSRRLIPLSKTGHPLPAKIKGHFVADGHTGENLILCASVVEDAHRVGSYLAYVKDACEIKFPVSAGAHKEIFALRDGPYRGSRRRPILHWVAKHLRATSTGTTPVKKHMRGVEEFVIDGFRIRLEPNFGSIGSQPRSRERMEATK